MNNIPKDISGIIFPFCEVREMDNLRKINKIFKSDIESNKKIYLKQKLINKYGSEIIDFLSIKYEDKSILFLYKTFMEDTFANYNEIINLFYSNVCSKEYKQKTYGSAKLIVNIYTLLHNILNSESIRGSVVDIRDSYLSERNDYIFANFDKSEINIENKQLLLILKATYILDRPLIRETGEYSLERTLTNIKNMYE